MKRKILVKETGILNNFYLLSSEVSVWHEISIIYTRKIWNLQKVKEKKNTQLK